MCAHIKSRNTSPLCCCYINLSKSNDSICMNHSCSRCVAMISMTIVWLSTIMFNEVLWRFLQIAMPRMNQTIRSITTKFKLYLNELFSFVLNFFCLFGCRLCSIGALHLVQSISACCVWSLNWLRDVFVKSFFARPPFSRHIFFFYKIKKKSYAANILPKCKAFIKCVSILHWRMFIVVIDFHQIGEKWINYDYEMMKIISNFCSEKIERYETKPSKSEKLSSLYWKLWEFIQSIVLFLFHFHCERYWSKLIMNTHFISNECRLLVDSDNRIYAFESKTSEIFEENLSK